LVYKPYFETSILLFEPFGQLRAEMKKKKLSTSEQPKSLWISHVVSNLYGTQIEIWAGFGAVDITEKKFGPIMINFWGQFFHVFMGKKSLIFFEYCRVRTTKLHKIKVKRINFFLKE
jgi:hypothetical protein